MHKWSLRYAHSQTMSINIKWPSKCQEPQSASMETERHMSACECTDIHIYWPSGLLQQPARCVIRLANQAEAEGCLPFIRSCLCVCFLIRFFSGASLALVSLSFFIALAGSLFTSAFGANANLHRISEQTGRQNKILLKSIYLSLIFASDCTLCARPCNKMSSQGIHCYKNIS